MELKIPIEVDFDDMKAVIDDLGQLQKYKLFEGDEMVLVDVDDVANVLIKHMKGKEAQPKTGEWEEYLKEGLRWKCSECGSRFETPWHFCPHCGSYNGGDTQ